MPTKSEDNFYVIDGIISLIYLFISLITDACEYLNQICSMICISDTEGNTAEGQSEERQTRELALLPPINIPAGSGKLCLQLPVITLTENNSPK